MKLENGQKLSRLSLVKAIADLRNSNSNSTVTVDDFESDTEFANALNCCYSLLVLILLILAKKNGK